MEIMATSMHASWMFGWIRYIGFFCNRQCIDITSNRYNRMLSRSDFCNYAGLQRKIQNMKATFL